MPLTMTGPSLGAIFAKAAKATLAKVQSAREDAARQTALDIEQAGRSDLSSAGNFGVWTGGFKATPDVGVSTTIKVTIDAPFWWVVHQTGATIQGNPWLYFRPGPKFSYLGDLIRKHQVTIPKRLNLVEVSKVAAGKFGDHFNQELKV